MSKSIVDKVLAGDIRTVARLIRDIDDGVPEVRQYLKALYLHTGKAHVIGITGSPGVGKSTLVDQMISHLREQKKTVGVLAVDPTSPFSGGAILGDRVRMQRHSVDQGVFIHSLATRGYFGGLTQSTQGAIDVLDATGKDYIIVETVGVGQDEVDVARAAHSTVIVVAPGMGDEIQAIKAGILEVGDIFVINKADRPGADKTLGDLSLMLDMAPKKYEQAKWKPPILKTEALFGKGVTEVLKQIENHVAHLKKSTGAIPLRRRREKVEQELTEMVKNRIIEEGFKQLAQTGIFDEAVQSIVDGKMDPYTACDTLILPRLGFSKP
jgi:LAO/AO transport system kinase